tara:strand:- start:407 stop:895 length:489 start_codon:yes stop_codon:yes gene_type:complete
MVGDHFLVRGYENGKHFAIREKFYPTLFVASKKPTKFKTLEGEYVESVEPGTVRDCREFIKRYDGVDNFKIYGNDRYIYQYISEKYPEEEIKFDTTRLKSLRLILRLNLKMDFQMLNLPLRKYSSLPCKTILPNRSVPGVKDPSIINNRMLSIRGSELSMNF